MEGARGPDRRGTGPSFAAWVPEPLARAGLRAGPTGEPAHGAGGGRRGGGREPLGPLRALATLLLRSEGVASSSIEGLRTPLAAVAAAEVGGAGSDAASEVADNLGAVIGALDRLSAADRDDLHR